MSRGTNSSLLIAPPGAPNLPPAPRTLNFVSREGDKISGQVVSALGICGFMLAWGICYFVKPIFPDELFIVYAGLTAAPMVLANVVFNKTHRRLTSGLSCESHHINVKRSLVKLIGLLATMLILFLIYGLLPERGRDFYRPAEQFILWFAGPTVLITVPYFFWIDSRMAVPEDGYWYMGLLVLGRWSMLKWSKVKEHALDWFIKSYFLPFMFAGSLVHLKMLTEKGIDMSSFGYFYGTCLNLLFAVDICFGAIGYLLTLRLLDAQIRTSEPTLLGWMSAVMCYAPIGPLIWNKYLNYEGKVDWQDWLIPYPILYISWAFLILLLLTIYTWSTCSFGCRFSNLTNRGIVVDGPYRYVKHPAYLSKNIAWWLMSVPFVSHATWGETLTACLCLFVTNLIYVIRALTEERHLMRDPAYVVYAKWIQQHGLLARIFRGFRKGVERSIMYSRISIIHNLLIGLIVAGTFLRLFICFYHNPLDYIISDASRHWTNGELLLHPNLMGKCDPLLYQVFVFIIQKVTGEQRFLIALVYGILSALMPWAFYRAARELGLAKVQSLAVWALIAWTPSLFVIFHYIMIEALLLPLEGVCLWMTARYLRKGDMASFLVCIVCWALACLTKPTAVALAITCLVFAWWKKSRKIPLLLIGCVTVFLLFVPQCVRSYYYLGFVAPTGSHWTPKILHKSDAKRIRIETSTGGHWGFSSPSCYVQPLEPLSPWMTHRAYEDSTVSIQVDLKNGDRDWKEAYGKLNRSWQVWFRQLGENIIIFLFAPSWPDSSLHDWDGWLNYELRWMWAPLICILFELNYLELRRGQFSLIPIAVTVLTLTLMFQNIIDMEGRYRKPLEPILLLNLVWVLGRSISKRNLNEDRAVRVADSARESVRN